MQKSALSNPFKWRSSYTRALALKLFIRESILRSNNINMTKAMHQYSTIRSTHNSFDKSSIMSGLLPPRLLLVQVEFEVFGDVSGMIRFNVKVSKQFRNSFKSIDYKFQTIIFCMI
jgi:hypothetical protein